MSTLHMSYDDSAYYLHPSRDPVEYDIAMALDMRPLGFGHHLPSDHLDGYIPASSSLVDHVIYDATPAYALQYPILSSSDFVDIRHPAPRRPISPEMLFPPEHPLEQSSSSSHQLNGYYQETSASLFPSGSFTQPSMFAPIAESSSHTQPAAADELPPPPPPSWAMSGSLDPATGIYQTAPEHPRVRTQQACEKCRGRKAKVCLHLCSLPLPSTHHYPHTVQRRAPVSTLREPWSSLRVCARAEDARAKQGQAQPRGDNERQGFQPARVDCVVRRHNELRRRGEPLASAAAVHHCAADVHHEARHTRCG